MTSICLLCVVFLAPLVVHGNAPMQPYSPVLGPGNTNETPVAEPTQTPRPTRSVFPENDADGEDLGVQDEIILPQTAASNESVGMIPLARVRVIDLFGYGLILIGVGLIWQFLTQRRNR